MKQVFQSIRTGDIALVDVPMPSATSGHLLVRVASSLISAGTEGALVGFASQSFVGKARARPDLVHEVVGKARREGLLAALGGVRNRLDEPIPLGYSNAGTVVEVGAGVTGFSAGDRVACGGGGFAFHAEYCSVPVNLVVPLADGVSFEQGSFCTVAAVALHAVRLARMEVGEGCAVIGLGLIGLLAVQAAKAAGCTVWGMDPEPERCKLAAALGCDATASTSDDFEALVHSSSSVPGADSILITAAAANSMPLQLAARVARDRARVVAVGDSGLEVPRRQFYAKELTLLVSRSYGPGRYDPVYEQQGHDYPAGYVRWTENRNMRAVARLLADRILRVDELVTHRFSIDYAVDAYRLVKERYEAFLAVLLTYPSRGEADTPPRRVDMPATERRQASGSVGVAVLGAGNFARATLLPALAKVEGIDKRGLVGATGTRAAPLAKRHGFSYCASDEREALQDSQVEAVIVATRHDSHARQVVEALGARKHVYCEKPLCLTEEQLEQVLAAAAEHPHLVLMVGLNRRFSRLARLARNFIASRSSPLVAHYRVNAGPLPAEHWLSDPAVGGGRLIGEGIHFVDFLMYLTNSKPRRVFAQAAPAIPDRSANVSVTLEFEDGSLGHLLYVATGDPAAGKERLEAFVEGRTVALDDFRHLTLTRGAKHQRHRERLRQDKGHVAALEAFFGAVQGRRDSPIPLQDIRYGMLATLRAVESLGRKEPLAVD